MMRSIRLTCLTLAAAGLGLMSCGKEDIGKTCVGKAPEDWPENPIEGEHSTVVEVVAMQRSSDCETFQCLSHRGYEPYCTRECTYKGQQKGDACLADTQCKRPQHCFEGFCQDDDCPAGYECRKAFEAGPYADKLFCVHKESCPGAGKNSECEALGEIDCVPVGCYDQALTPGAEADADAPVQHVLTCVPRTQLDAFCQCAQGGTVCSSTEYTCDPPGENNTWPDASVELRNVCLPK